MSAVRISICIAAALLLATAAQAQYATHAQIGTRLLQAQTDHPAICQRFNIGNSMGGRALWAVRISDNVGVEEDEPEFKWVSSMHGDEVVGAEMCLRMIDYLTDNYGTDTRVTNLVNGMDIWIVPLMNPDGYERSPRTRTNNNGVDLNRDFPDPFTSPNNTTAGRETETAVIMNWSFGRSFVLSANLHGGELVVNYPYDNNPAGASVFTPSPDEDMFVYISEQYSVHNAPMWNSTSFTHGITNGAEWYAVDGGMQDWNYRYMGDNEVTIELGQTKEPAYSQMPTYWTNNRDSMLSYMETALMGVRGVITDAASGLPVDATVAVLGRDHDIYTDPLYGNYHRMLLAGTYDLSFEAAGYDTVTAENVVVTSGDATRLDLEMGPPPDLVSPDGGETLYSGIPQVVSWTGPDSAQFQVQYTTNYGAQNNVTDDFERTTLGANYTTGGNANWLTSTTSYHAGARSAKAGTISSNGITWMERTITGPATVSFWYRVSSESGYDYYRFYVDGGMQTEGSGTVNWTLGTYNVGAGSHVLRWEYSKDGSLNSGSDTAWVDDLQIQGDATVWTDAVAATPIGADSAYWSPPAPGSTYRVRVRALYGPSVTGGWAVGAGNFSVALGGDIDGNCHVDAQDLALLLAAWEIDDGGDLDGNGLTDAQDLAFLLGNFDAGCP